MTTRAHDALMRIGVYIANQIESLDPKEQVEVWSEVARWCEGDIEGSGYRMDEEGDWVPVEDDD